MSLVSDKLEVCWKKIGIWGTSSCVLLPTYIHCRNCHVYEASAARLLDRPIPQDYLTSATLKAAETTEVAEKAAQTALIFRLQDEWFALPAAKCSEIAPYQRAHSIPFRKQGSILGLVNVRGELLICVSLEKLLSVGQSQVNSEPARRLVVISYAGNRYAFPASEVFGLLRYSENDLKPAPETLIKAHSHLTNGLVVWNDKPVGVIDDELLFYMLNKGLT